jgi:hypothetical protein
MPFGVQVVDNAVKERIVDQFIGSSAGRKRLAASMVVRPSWSSSSPMALCRFTIRTLMWSLT